MVVLVNERQILIAAKEVCGRARTDGHELATTADGVRCRPIDPAAVAWSPTGAVFFVEPWMSRDHPKVWGDTTDAGEESLRLLDQAALAMDYANAVRCSIDGGPEAEQAMFARAINLAPARRTDPRALR